MIPKIVLAAALLALPLTACSKSEDKTAADATTAEASAVPKAAELADALGKANDLSTANRAIKEAGLDKVFDGKGAYTVFAPTNAAFDALGEKGTELLTPEQRAPLAAMLREHIVPGYLTPADIGKALDAAKGNPVKMRTVGNGALTFTRDGKAVHVAAPDGSGATLGGEAVLARNGVAIPIDKVLAKL